MAASKHNCVQEAATAVTLKGRNIRVSMFILPYIGLDKAFRLDGQLYLDASSLLPGRCYPTSESVSQHPSDPLEQSEWSETEPEDECEEADEHDEELESMSTERDNDTHLLL